MVGLLNPVNEKGANPQNQDMLDAFIANGVKIIHNDKVSDSFTKSIVNADEPIKAIADATLNVVARLEQGGQKRRNLPPEVLAQGANLLMGEIILVAESAGLEPLTDEEKYMAYSLAVSKYIDGAIKSGKMTPEQLEQMSQQAQQTPEGQKIVAETQNIAGGQGGMAQGEPAVPGAVSAGTPPAGRV